LDVLRESGLRQIKMPLRDAYEAQWRQHVAAIDITNEPRWCVGDTVATGLLKNNPDFFSIKTKKKQIKKPSSNLQIPPKLTPKCCLILH